MIITQELDVTIVQKFHFNNFRFFTLKYEPRYVILQKTIIHSYG